MQRPAFLFCLAMEIPKVRFEDATITKEVDDLGSVLDAIRRIYNLLRRAQYGRCRRRIAGEHRCAHSASHLSGWHGRYKGICTARVWRCHPRTKATCGTTRIVPLSSAYMDDLTAIDTVVNRASQISVPWLLVHGTEDDVVPIEDSQVIFERANEPKELVVLSGADHVFSDDATPAMIQTVINWISKQEY